MKLTGQLHGTAAVPSGKNPYTPSEEEAEWIPGLACAMRRKGKSIVLPGIETGFLGCRPIS
jgi:hypothetical protein